MHGDSNIKLLNIDDEVKTALKLLHKFSSTLSLTSAIGKSGWSPTHYGYLTPRKEPPYPFLGEVLWSPWTVWTGMEKRPLVHTGLRTSDCTAPSESLRRLRYHGTTKRRWHTLKLRCACTQFPLTSLTLVTSGFYDLVDEDVFRGRLPCCLKISYRENTGSCFLDPQCSLRRILDNPEDGVTANTNQLGFLPLKTRGLFTL